MSLEFQDGRGVTFCCEGENAPGSVQEGNETGWSGCDSIRQGNCTIASVGPRSVGVNTNLQVGLYFDNSGGGTEVTYVVGDPIGLIAELSDKTLVTPSSGSISPTIFNKYIGERGYTITSMSITVSDEAMYIGNFLTIVTANISGQICYTPLRNRINALNPRVYASDAERYLPLRPAIRLNTTTCLLVTVPAGETCGIAFG